MSRITETMDGIWSRLDTLILVAGHAIYRGTAKSEQEALSDEHWILQSFQVGEAPFYIEHIRYGVELAQKLPTSLLVFSGGQTRSPIGNAKDCVPPFYEGQSYFLLADLFQWWNVDPVIRDRSTTEDFSRDSFDNVLFGLCRFKECTGHYPDNVHIISWSFKKERFDIHRNAVRYPASRFYYHGVGEPKDMSGALIGEKKAVEQFKKDPYGIQGELMKKKLERNPCRRSHGYIISCPEIVGLLSHVSSDLYSESSLPWECIN